MPRERSTHRPWAKNTDPAAGFGCSKTPQSLDVLCSCSWSLFTWRMDRGERPLLLWRKVINVFVSDLRRYIHRSNLEGFINCWCHLNQGVFPRATFLQWVWNLIKYNYLFSSQKPLKEQKSAQYYTVVPFLTLIAKMNQWEPTDKWNSQHISLNHKE